MVELEADTLSPEEWFVVQALAGTRPEALPQHAMEFRQRVLGMSKLEQQRLTQQGVESLMAKKFIDYRRDKNGKPVRDPADGQLIYECKGRIVARVKLIDPYAGQRS